jgi:hypothetical protein
MVNELERETMKISLKPSQKNRSANRAKGNRRG